MNVEQLANQLVQMSHRFRKIFSSDFALGMCRLDFMILKYIRQANLKGYTVTGSQLAKHLEVSPPAISRKMKDLEEKGWIQRVNAAEDRRNTWLQMTTTGECVIDEAMQQLREMTCQAVGQMNEEDILQHIEIGNRLADLLQAQLDEQRNRINKEGKHD